MTTVTATQTGAVTIGQWCSKDTAMILVIAVRTLLSRTIPDVNRNHNRSMMTNARPASS